MVDISKVILTVVDQSPIRSGGAASEALHETVALARHAEKCGYSRYWVAEHHNSGSFTGTSPEILIGQIAAKTTTIRVGSGGVMLSHYSSLKVAEQFRMLDAFYPGRIDLGVGRAPGSDRLTAAALAYPRPQIDVLQDFPKMISDLIGFLHNSLDESHPMSQIQVLPGHASVTSPEVWLLGSSDYSSRLAAAMGLPFSFADFFGNTSDYGPRVTDLYRKQFQPSEFLSEPRVNVGLQVICAPTEEEARFIGTSRSLNKILPGLSLRTGGLLPPEEAANWPLDKDAQEYMMQMTKSYIEGNPDQVRDGILHAAERYQTGDLGIITNCYYFEHRKISYELVAKCLGVTSENYARS